MNTSNIIKISIDAMGGDFGLPVTIPASISALSKNKKLHIVLVGIESEINACLNNHSKNYDKSRITVRNATEVVAMDEAPSNALRYKKDSSMRVAINLLKDKTVSACISAGNTGALMATSKFVLKTLQGIDRPAIVYAVPSYDRKTKIMKSAYMLDLGANIDCNSEQLFQFAIMGSILAKSMQKIPQELPRVALLNIGAEEIKGLDSIKQAAKMLNQCSNINYTGFIEGDDIFNASADVIVCDGFVGNVSLKTMEGTAKLISDTIKDNFNSSIFTKLAMLCAAPVLKKISKRLNTEQYNGASLLGLKGIVIKSHGGANASAFETAINEAVNEIHHDIPNKIQLTIQEMI